MNINPFKKNLLQDDISFIENQVRVFKQLYSGYCPQFHDFYLGEENKKHQMTSLNMTKQVAEDNASLIVNENLSFNIEDNQVADFLLGDDPNSRGGELNRIDFWGETIRFTEKLYSYSGSVLLTYLPNFFLEQRPFIEGGFKFKFLTTLDFAVSKCGHTIYFESEAVRPDGKNKIFQIIDKRFVYLDDEYLGDTGYDCVFQLNTASANNFYEGSHFSIAPQMNALSWLVFCDLAHNNFKLDFALGKKLLFVGQDYLTTQVGGKKLNKKLSDLIFSIPTTEEMKNTLVKEFNPTIRVAENKDGLNFGLQRLGEKVGFGKKFYQADEAGNITAYQTRVSNYTLTYYLEKQRTGFRSVLPKFCQAVALANGLPESVITCVFDDKALRDPETERKDDMALVSSGLMSKSEFRVKWFDETPDEAEGAIEKIEKETPTLAGGFMGF